jgi:hypothetical protein
MVGKFWGATPRRYLLSTVAMALIVAVDISATIFTPPFVLIGMDKHR